jgi:alpha-D-ribose 1-methylphosphonate 5-triphosphate diphosphatase
MMHELGVHMSEIPINLETAAAASAKGLPTILGAPNVLRGQSQSGSMRAIDAIEAGTVSCLCSDYQPSTLVAAAFVIADSGAMSLPNAVALISANPAEAATLLDRGHIAPNRRADLVAVSLTHTWPAVTRTWCAGRLVFSAEY